MTMKESLSAILLCYITTQPLTYFGLRHIPYVCLSMTVIVTFVIIPPAILILYPTRCFKRLLERCRFKRWHSLSIIMDVFQGWYKDGTNGSYDYRALSALYMVLRICYASEFILVFMFQYRTRYNGFEWTLPSLVHIALGCFYLTVKPYKKTWMNVVDGLVLVLMGTSTAFMVMDEYNLGLAFLMVLLPFLVASIYVMRICFIKTKLMHCCKNLCNALLNFFVRRNVLAVREAVSDDNDLLDQRLLQSDRINPLHPSLSFQQNGNNRNGFGSNYGSVN